MELALPKPELPKLPEPPTQEQMVEVLGKVYELATNGIPGQKSCSEVAEEYLDRYPDTKLAIKRLTANQAAVCATSGFLTNLGGIITLPVAVPANITSVLYVQMRMIAVIASMGGYDVHDDAVQSFIYVCLAGMSVTDILKDTGVKFANKTVEALVKKVPGTVLTKINKKVGFRFVTKAGTKSLVTLSKLVPVAGGVVGGGVDFFGTKTISRRAYKMFIEGQVD